MATLELDAVFVKALRLLHSKAKDSTAQLRAMVDDAISSKKFKTGDGDSKPVISRMAQKEEESKKREAEKRKYDKLRMEISDLEGSDVKKAKTELSKEERKEREREKEKEKHRRDKEKREQEKERERQEKEKQKELEREREREKEKQRQKEKDAESDESTEEEDNNTMTMDADDFAFDLGVCCEVCNKFDVASGNQLVECQECHALYHQECHKPPVTERDVNDPRFVWYCQKCTKSMKKMAAQKPPKSKPTPPPSSSKESPGSKSSKTDPLVTTLPFRRVEVKPQTSSSKESPSAAAAQPLRGLAGLAANLSKPSSSKADAKSMQPGWGKSDISKSSHKDGTEKSSRSESSKSSSKEAKGEKSVSPTSSSAAGSSAAGGGKWAAAAAAPGGNGGKNPSISMSGNSMANADKRLKMMKKNAAKKQENRIHIK